MKKHFYSHLVEIDSLVIELDKLELKQDERDHLVELAHSNIHHSVLDVILSELPEEEKKTFLYLLATEDHESLWSHLKKHVKQVDKKIVQVAEKVKKELKSDIRGLQKRSENG